MPHRDLIAFSPWLVVVIDRHEISHILNLLNIDSIKNGLPKD